jgi:hypothetical protein
VDDIADSRDTRCLPDGALSQQDNFLVALFRQTADSKKANTSNTEDIPAPAIKRVGDKQE